MKKLLLLSILCMFSLSLVACTNDNAEMVEEDIYEEDILVESVQEQDKGAVEGQGVGAYYAGGGEERNVLG